LKLRTDVAIVGGGPAGVATALTLRRHAPELEVALLEAGDYGGPRLGETLPPLARQLLRQLDVWDDFEALVEEGLAREVHGTEIVWGSPRPHRDHYLSHGRGAGWHLDRPRFDAMLARAAEARGVEVRRGVRVRGLESAWHLEIENGETLESRFVVDAAGPTAPIARRLGAESESFDRLVASARFFQGAEGDPGLSVEAREHGWWYAAGLPGRRLVAVCLSDADLARELELGTAEGWQRALASTEITALRASGASPEGEIVVRSAASRRLDRAAGVGEGGAGWLAVGDAASVFDPLSSQGIAKALRGGIFAAYAIGDHLVQGEKTALEKYRRFAADEFNAYLETRAGVYADEHRWPESPFWSRRLGAVNESAEARSDPRS